MNIVYFKILFVFNLKNRLQLVQTRIELHLGCDPSYRNPTHDGEITTGKIMACPKHVLSRVVSPHFFYLISI